MKSLITGSGVLIGSEFVRFLCKKGFDVTGIDNDMRSNFFGEEASTKWNSSILTKSFINYKHLTISHDWAAKFPFTDFTVNANGTLNLLENFRKYCPEVVFIFTSTNKVYGDTPNRLPLITKETRFDLPDGHIYYEGIDETMSIDNSKHSLFGISKLSADLLVQEYGKYFNLKTTVFRGGCLTGPTHSGTELHGFLSYSAKCIKTERRYKIYGYKGKQVRDSIHSYDMVNAFHYVFLKPRCGEVYNIGGSRHSNISVIEAIEKIEELAAKKADIEYIDHNREGDHIWYISNVSKFRRHYPMWDYKYDIDMILKEMCADEK